MTIKELQIQGEKDLNEAKIPSANLDAEVLLSYVLNQPKEYIYTYPQNQINPKSKKIFTKLISKRVKHIPIAYLTNHREFYSLDFIVNKNVLIPRPETEMIIDEIKSIKPTNKTILDIGTGSGCIAIALKKILPTINMIATDISSKALSVAKKNAEKHNTKIKFIKSDLLNKLQKEKIDILIANLPYLPQNEKEEREKISPEIKQEPKLALWTNENGLKLYRKLFTQINSLGHKPKLIICEIDPTQTQNIAQLISSTLPEYTSSIIKDLSNKDRMIKLVAVK